MDICLVNRKRFFQNLERVRTCERMSQWKCTWWCSTLERPHKTNICLLPFVGEFCLGIKHVDCGRRNGRECYYNHNHLLPWSIFMLETSRIIDHDHLYYRENFFCWKWSSRFRDLLPSMNQMHDYQLLPCTMIGSLRVSSPWDHRIVLVHHQMRTCRSPCLFTAWRLRILHHTPTYWYLHAWSSTIDSLMLKAS